jgi:hypothetical protein
VPAPIVPAPIVPAPIVPAPIVPAPRPAPPSVGAWGHTRRSWSWLQHKPQRCGCLPHPPLGSPFSPSATALELFLAPGIGQPSPHRLSACSGCVCAVGVGVGVGVVGLTWLRE